jgi:hypothetical protein
MLTLLQNAATTTAPVELAGSRVTTLTKATFEAHTASISAATKGKAVTAKASVMSALVHGKRRAEEQLKEGALPKKPKITHLPSATATTQSQKRPGMAAPTIPAAPVNASAAVKKGDYKAQVETDSGSTPEEAAINLNATSVAKAVVVKVKGHREPARLAGKKRKLGTTEDVETSVETESKKQRLPGPT